MASARQLFFDLLARDKTGPATKSAADNLDDVGDAAKDAERKTEKLGRQASETGRDIAKLDAEAKLLEKELQDLARAFARTDNAAERLDISKTVRKMEADLKRINKNKGLLEKLLPDPEPAAKSFMTKIGGALNSAGDGIATLAGNHVGLTIGGAIGAAAAPVAVSAIGSALSAGLGAGVIGVGILAAAKSDATIQIAGAAVAKKFGDGLAREADAALKEPILGSLDILSQAGDQITARLGTAFRKLAPEVEPFTRKVAAAGVALTDDLAGAAEKSGPALDALGDSVQLLGNGIGNFVSAVSSGGPEAASNLRLIAGATADVVSQTGLVIGGLEKLANNPWVTGPLLPLLRKHYDNAADETDAFAEKTRKLNQALTDAAVAAQMEGSELTNLAADMRAQTDPVFGLLNAQDRLAEAQKNVAQATKDHGKNSKEAKQALRDLAEAAIEVEGRAGDLAATSNGKLSPALRATLRAAGLTEGQINGLAGQFRNAKKTGDSFSKTYKAKVEADTAKAESRIQHVRDLLAKVRSKKISVSVLVADSQLDKVNNTLDRFGGARAGGGPVKRGKAYIVGEKRAEVFVPDQNGTIIPSVEEFAGSSGRSAVGVASQPAAGPTVVIKSITIPITGATKSPREIAREVSRELGRTIDIYARGAV